MKYNKHLAGAYTMWTATDARCPGIAQVPRKGGGQRGLKHVCGNLITAADKTRGVVRVTGISVIPEAQRGALGVKVATKLYEHAAQDACKRFGLPLASDTSRSDKADPFWRKQVAKGRAHWTKLEQDGGESRAVLSCPAPSSLDGIRRKRR